MVETTSDQSNITYGEQSQAMQTYLAQGTQRALALPNRGALRFTENGAVAPDILQAYADYGFYVFEGLISTEELEDLKQDVQQMWANAPVRKGALEDQFGRPALASNNTAPILSWVKPLSDPLGGTSKSNGRHPAKMYEPPVPDGAPEHVLQLVLGSLQFSDACLRLYAHPALLGVAAAIHGDDFVPFNEAVWVKHPRLGGSVAWHQDGWTHWDSPQLDADTHGFNFMAQLYGCTAANAVWVVPGSHRVGKVDIKEQVAAAGTDRLPNAVPLICKPGDVVICNRQAVHGSFANTSDDIRVTVNFGFHRRSSVEGVESGGVHNKVMVYTEEHIQKRSEVIGYAINARGVRFPDETPYVYQPLKDEMSRLQYTPQTKLALHDYNLLDLGI